MNEDTLTMEIYSGAAWKSIHPIKPTPKVFKKKFVVAGNYGQYKYWLSQKGYMAHEYIYVSDVNMMRGIENPTGFFVGTYEQRPDIDEIKMQIRIAQR
jgi:hypothetical protein